jgi:hypothetical protein
MIDVVPSQSHPSWSAHHSLLGSAVLVNSWLMRRRAMQRFDSGVRRAKGALSVSPFDKPKKGRIAVKVINHLGDKVMKVFRV